MHCEWVARLGTVCQLPQIVVAREALGVTKVGTCAGADTAGNVGGEGVLPGVFGCSGVRCTLCGTGVKKWT